MSPQPTAIERTFLTPKKEGRDADSNIPSLDEFDAEIDIYRVNVFTISYISFSLTLSLIFEFAYTWQGESKTDSYIH